MLTTISSQLALALPLLVAHIGPPANQPQRPQEPIAEAESPPREAPWVVRSQSLEGFWAGDAEVGEAGTTALTLLGLLGSGQTTTAGPHRAAVARGFAWLTRQLDPETDRVVPTAGDPGGLLEHIWTSLALSEFTLLDPPALQGDRAPRLAVAALLHGQAKDGSFGDARTTGWACFALLSARDAQIPVPPEALERAHKALQSLTKSDEGRQPSDASALALRVLIDRLLPATGAEASSPAQDRLQRFVGEADSWRSWNPEQRMLAAYASFQCGGDIWRLTSRALRPIAERRGRNGFPAEGSMGAMRSSAFGMLTRQVHYRYARLLGAR